eukprot:SAG11_NODE_37920_length_254_cov_1.645161_2_plen_34_part_01
MLRYAVTRPGRSTDGHTHAAFAWTAPLQIDPRDS